MIDDGLLSVHGVNETDGIDLAIELSGTGVWDRDFPSGRIHYSRAWKAILGYRDDEITDRIEDSYTRVHPDDLAMVKATIEAHFRGHTPMYKVEHRLRCKDGHYKWVISRGQVSSRGADGKPLRMTGMTTDISDTVALSEKLRQNVELLTHLTDEVPGLVYQYRQGPDGHASFPYASAGISELFGTTPALAAESAGAVEQAIHPDDIATYLGSLAVSAVTLERWQLEFRVCLPNAGEIWCQGEARPRRMADGGTVWHGFISDITERKKIERKLHEAAATDFLTGLPNRRHIMARMEQELSRVQRDPTALAVVLMFDLDHFKAINDDHGHAMGDEVLKHFSMVLLHELRKVDSVGRIGGEEFAIVLSGADDQDGMRFAERVRARLAATPLVGGTRSYPVTVSIGIAVMRTTDLEIADALSRADAAMYKAKQGGRNRVEVSL